MDHPIGPLDGRRRRIVSIEPGPAGNVAITSTIDVRGPVESA